MARKRPFLDFIKNTINQVQNQNQQNPNEQTAQPSVFDMIKNQIQNVQKPNQEGGGGSIFDIIKGRVEDARQQNTNDPNQETAPGSVFDKIKDQVEGFRDQNNKDDFDLLLDEYNIDDETLDATQLQQIENAFNQERQQLRQRFAQQLRGAIKPTTIR